MRNMLGWSKVSGKERIKPAVKEVTNRSAKANKVGPSCRQTGLAE